MDHAVQRRAKMYAQASRRNGNAAAGYRAGRPACCLADHLNVSLHRERTYG